MVQVSYLFLPSDVNRNSTLPGQWMLEVHLNSDDGFTKPADGTEPDPDAFRGAAESVSQISIYAWYCTAETNQNWISGVWDVMQWPEDNQILETVDPPFKVFGKTVDLADLPNHQAVKAFASTFKDEASMALGATLA